MYNKNVASNTNSSSVPTGPQASSIKTGNENNQNPTINFIWLYKVNEGIIKKIARGEKIDITDIIPNSFSIIHDTQTNQHSYKSKYFAQTMVSWAINYPNNQVRLIVKPMFASLLSADEIAEGENCFNNLKYTNRSKKSFFEDLYDKKIERICNNEQRGVICSANVTCEYDKCFNDFATTVNQKIGHNNFSIVDFNQLADAHLKKDEIAKDKNLNFLLNQDSISDGFDLPISIDILRLCINYYGFGYEKNLTLDMDYSYHCLKLLDCENQKITHQDIRINALSSDIMLPIKRDTRGQKFFYENSCVYTSRSKHEALGYLLDNPEFNRSTIHYPLWEKTVVYLKRKFSLSGDSEECLKRSHQKGIFSELLWYIQPSFIDKKSYNQNVETALINKTLSIHYRKDFWPFRNDYLDREYIKNFFLHAINNFNDIYRFFIVGFLKNNDIFIYDDRIFNIVNNMKKNYNNYPTITANASGPNSSIVYNGGTGLNGNNQTNLVLNASGRNSSIVCNDQTGLNGNNQSNPQNTINALHSAPLRATSTNPKSNTNYSRH